MTQHKLLQSVVYGLLALCGLVGVATLVWSAIPQGAPVLYTAPDTAAVPILMSPDLRSTGLFSASGAVVFSGIITPPALPGTSTNDYSPTGFATAQALKLTSTAAHTLTGLSAAASGTWKTIYNANPVGGFAISLVAESASSVAANRFALTGNLVLPPQSGVQLQYEGTGSTGRYRTGSRVFLMTTILPTQFLAANVSIQHSLRPDAIEIVQIQSNTSGNVLNGAATRIAAGLDGQLILLQGMSASQTYTIPDGNGVKWATGSSVTFDDRQSRLMEYSLSAGTWREAVTGAGGGGGGGTATSTSFAPTGGLSATNVQTALAELDSEAEKIAQKNIVNGYMGLNSAGDAIWDRVDGYAAAAALMVNSAIDAATLQVRTIGIESAGTGNLLLNGTANPRITGCTSATGGTGRNSTRLAIRGTHPTKTVTIPTGNGVKLAGNTGTVTVGSNLSSVIFECDEGNELWVQMGVPSAQQVFNVGTTVTIYACGDARNPKYDGGGGTTLEFCLSASGSPGWKALVAGAPTDSMIQLDAGKKFCVMKSDLTTPLFCVNDSGAVTGLSAQQGYMGNLLNAPTACSSGGTLSYFALLGRTGGSGFSETQVQQPWPFAQTLTRVHLQYLTTTPSFPAGQTATYRVRKNGADTPITFAINAGILSGTWTGSYAVAQDDLMTLQVSCSGGSTALGDFSWNIVSQ